MSAKNIKIFIASAGEVGEERKKTVLALNHLGKLYPHLQLESVQWETDLIPGSQPEHGTVQGAINPDLLASDFVLFIFYAKLGQYTKEEFELAINTNKKCFVFFKEGFTTSDIALWHQYGELLTFKQNLNSNVLHLCYKDADQFYDKLYQCLSQYLFKVYPVADVRSASATPLSMEVTTLIKLLAEKENRIKEFENLLPALNSGKEVQKLTDEIAAIKTQLFQSEELCHQQAADKSVLEQQLAGQQESDALKAQALAAVGKGDYALAETLLLASSKDKRAADTASTFYELAKVKQLQLQYREAYQYYELAAQIASDNSLLLNDAGMMAKQLGYIEKAMDYYKKCLPFIIAAYGRWSPQIAALYNNMGEAYQQKGDHKNAIQYCIKALCIDRGNYGKRHPVIATRYNSLGSICHDKGDYNHSIKYFEDALSIDKEFYGERHPETAIRYNNLGLVYHSKGEYNLAVEYYTNALSIDEAFYGERHPTIATRYNNLGVAYCSKGEYDNAIECHIKALDISNKFYGESHPCIAIRYNNLGSAYHQKKAYDLAITYYEKSLTIGKMFYGDAHPYIAIDYNNLGSAYSYKGNYDSAIEYYGLALSIAKEYIEQHPTIAILYHNLGSAYRNKNEYAIALSYYEQASTIYNQFFSPDHPYIAALQESYRLTKEAMAQNNPFIVNENVHTC